MEYTIQKMARLAGISTRTLRYYDEIGLLKPARVNAAGYRIYGLKEVNLLQQVLFYRELDFNLEEIKHIIYSPQFDHEAALHDHHQKLLERREQLNQLIRNVEQTILQVKGEKSMTDQEKFEGFKKEIMEKNERAYGDEVREKYGGKELEAANQKFQKMTKKEYEDATLLEQQLLQRLKEVLPTNDPTSDQGQHLAEMHKKWLSYYWGHYSKQAHAGLANMYVQDERFKSYYDQHGEGAAQFLRDAIVHYTR